MEVDIFNVEQWEKPKTLDDAIKMIRKLKDMFPIAGIIWQPEDVIQFGNDYNPPYNVPDYIAIEVIEAMEDAKDCNYGLTWDLLADILIDKMDGVDDEPVLCPRCNGSGEGQHDGTTCFSCKGTGEVKNG